jgi:hypothetical protein
MSLMTQLGFVLPVLVFGSQALAQGKCYDLSPDAKNWFNPTHDSLCISTDAHGFYTFRIKSDVTPGGALVLREFQPDSQATCAAGTTENYIPDQGMPSAISGLGIKVDACDPVAAPEGVVAITIGGTKVFGRPGVPQS